MAFYNGKEILFSSEVKIGSGGNANLIDKEITENGTYLASEDGADGYSSVNVNVAGSSEEPNLQEKIATENGEVVADDGYDGLSKVTVNVAGGKYNVEQVILDDYSCELHITDVGYVAKYNLTLEEASSWITISNDVSGQYSEGEEVLVSANFSGDGRLTRFSGWYEGDTLLTTETSFTYTMPNRNVTLTAKASDSIST